MHKPLILELNNLDILGRRFDGYDLTEHFSKNPANFSIEMLVNNRLSRSSIAKDIFRSRYIEECDWAVQAAEQKFLGTKNQISLADGSLRSNQLFYQADILHFHQYHNMNLPIEFLADIGPRQKIIIDLHDTFWLTDNSIPMLTVFNYTDANAKTLNAQRKRILNGIDAHFVVHSPYMLNLFKKSNITKNIKNVHLINFGIDTNIFKPFDEPTQKKLRQKLNIAPNNIVLFCRAQNDFKGTEYVHEALQKLHAQKPITLITVVNKDMFSDLTSSYQIIDFGTVYSDQKMAELFNVCDIFLSPSTEESFGFMAAEAMACGKPVIVFDGTALPYTTGAPEIGISIPKSSTALVKTISALIDDEKERLSRGKKAIKFVQKNYSQNQYFNSYAKLFRQVLKTPRKPKITPPTNRENPQIHDFRQALTFAHTEIVKHRSVNPPNYQYPSVDYNSREVQDMLQEFNAGIYHDIKTSNRIRHLASFFKSLVPKPIKKALKFTYRTIRTYMLRPIKLIIKKIIRR